MEELNQIISAVSRYTEVCKGDIMSGNDRESTKARGFVCHILRDGFPYLLSTFQGKSKMSRQAVYQAARRTDVCIKNDAETRHLMNRIRERMKLLPIKDVECNAKHPYISPTKRLFGFDYTDKERLRRKNAIISSMRFMDRLCSFGRQPIIDGMVYSTVRTKKIRNSWYND